MDLTTRALCYLAAFERGLPIDGGLAYSDDVRALRLLEPSWDSLSRIDEFLDALREREKPDMQQYCCFR